MRAAVLVFAAIALVSSAAAAAPRRAARAPVFVRPAPPLPMLPVVGRVHLEIARDHVLVVEDVHLDRDEWNGGGLDLYVAYGAPGAPRAFDARLLPVAGDEAYAPLEAAGDPIDVDPEPHCPADAQPLLGRPQMAGAVLHLDDDALRRAFAPGDLAAVRVRTLTDLPGEDVHGARELVIRLGAARGAAPLALRRVELVASGRRPFVVRAESALCGAEADPYPLDVHVFPALPMPPRLEHLPLAPPLAVRHATDDLCVRFWTNDAS